VMLQLHASRASLRELLPVNLDEISCLPQYSYSNHRPPSFYHESE
jgi:hypothetical protein